MERGHDMLYICYDNEAYMNTGVQRSGATPYGASTTTSPPGSQSVGNDRPKKDMPQIIAAHNVPYVATASIAFPLDYMAKVEKALQVKGPSYIHIHASCTPGWGIPSDKGIEIPRLAVDSGMWVLYEIVNGDTRVTYKPAKKQSVKSYLKMQKRFKHLDEPAIEQIQAEIDKNWDKIFGGKS
jgi:pyruvate ferredoxin oxidoreductase beta subunit